MIFTEVATTLPRIIPLDGRPYISDKIRLHVVERFTRVGAKRIHYEFMVNDATTWTNKWSAEVPMVKTDGPIFEYGCHEGNHDIRHILEINRSLERQAADAKQTSK